MKRILIFIGLKIAEILGVCGIIGVIYGIGRFSTNVVGYATHMVLWWEVILVGVLGLLVLFSGFLAGLGIWEAIKANWKWAGRLTK